MDKTPGETFYLLFCALAQEQAHFAYSWNRLIPEYKTAWEEFARILQQGIDMKKKIDGVRVSPRHIKQRVEKLIADGTTDIVLAMCAMDTPDDTWFKVQGHINKIEDLLLGKNDHPFKNDHPLKQCDGYEGLTFDKFEEKDIEIL